MWKRVCIWTPPARFEWTGIPAEGVLLARLPGFFPVAFFPPVGEKRAFVPITAAGQRGLFTPLPHIHSVFENDKPIEQIMRCVNQKSVEPVSNGPGFVLRKPFACRISI